jgi:glyoxylase-like metal-dependent hydrolase (beta-lactamase superfamily II)
VAILRTHTHHDHVVNEDELVRRYSIPVLAEPGEWRWDDLRVRALATPGHSDDGLSFVIDDDAVATGDTLFRDAVGGGDLDAVRRSVMEVLLELPDTTRVLPGHADETTIGRERRENPFIRVWSGAEEEGSERVRVGGRDATLIVWSPDYDGNGKAWVRYDDGEEATVGGSRVERAS